MKIIAIILILLLNGLSAIHAQENSVPDFTWDNSFYYNLNVGESIIFNGTELKLLKLDNHFNLLKTGNDTIVLKVSRRTPSVTIGNLSVFVADNKNVKALATDKKMHGLLTKDALVCITNASNRWLDRSKYIFPVSFNDGFLWNVEEDSYLFSYMNMAERKLKGYDSHAGIDFDLDDARGIEKHWILAIENSTVIWFENEIEYQNGKSSSVLLESESQPGIYYLYKHLNSSNLKLKKGQKLVMGEPIGTVWGDDIRGNLHLAVIKSTVIPSYSEVHHNIVSCFPQIFELYFNQPTVHSKHFPKGRIFFGRNRSVNGNQKNASAYEFYSGKGWILNNWNVADKVEYVSKGTEGNVRLSKILFEGYAGECVNPDNWYDYEINVPNGVYRIRAKLGDVNLPTWQKIEFENVEAGVFLNKAGEFKWSPEKVVKVFDSKLTVRIYVDENNEKPAGISEIVFQQAL